MASESVEEDDLVKIEVECVDKRCILCKRSTVDELNLGPLYQRNGVVAHYYCVLFCSNLKQNGADEQGILGFLTEDIKNEVKRVHSNGRNAKFYRCRFCKGSGATIGCCEKSCRCLYHFPCGVSHAASFRFTSTFSSYCNKHKTKCLPQAIIKRVNGPKRKMCPICTVAFPRGNTGIIFGTCCLPSIFHKECIQAYALNSGCLFKCPTCADTHIFKVDVRMQGIFVPHRDAAWELEPNAFEDLKIRHSRCDAEDCQCPSGRNYADKEIGSNWSLLRCYHCAATATHVGCGVDLASCYKWVCETCSEVEKRVEERRMQEPATATTSSSRKPSTNSSSNDNDSSDEGSAVSSSSGTLFSPIRKSASSPPNCDSSSSNTLFSLVKPGQSEKEPEKKISVITISSSDPESGDDSKKDKEEDSSSSSDSLFIKVTVRKKRLTKKRQISSVPSPPSSCSSLHYAPPPPPGSPVSASEKNDLSDSGSSSGELSFPTPGLNPTLNETMTAKSVSPPPPPSPSVISVNSSPERTANRGMEWSPSPTFSWLSETLAASIQRKSWSGRDSLSQLKSDTPTSPEDSMDSFPNSVHSSPERNGSNISSSLPSFEHSQLLDKSVSTTGNDEGAPSLNDQSQQRPDTQAASDDSMESFPNSSHSSPERNGSNVISNSSSRSPSLIHSQLSDKSAPITGNDGGAPSLNDQYQPRPSTPVSSEDSMESLSNSAHSSPERNGSNISSSSPSLTHSQLSDKSVSTSGKDGRATSLNHQSQRRPGTPVSSEDSMESFSNSVQLSPERNAVNAKQRSPSPTESLLSVNSVERDDDQSQARPETPMSSEDSVGSSSSSTHSISRLRSPPPLLANGSTESSESEDETSTVNNNPIMMPAAPPSTFTSFTSATTVVSSAPPINRSWWFETSSESESEAGAVNNNFARIIPPPSSTITNFTSASTVVSSVAASPSRWFTTWSPTSSESENGADSVNQNDHVTAPSSSSSVPHVTSATVSSVPSPASSLLSINSRTERATSPVRDEETIEVIDLDLVPTPESSTCSSEPPSPKRRRRSARLDEKGIFPVFYQ